MSTETVLTDEQKDRFVSEICEYGTGFVAPLYSVVEAIEQAVLQSPEVQALREKAARYDWLRDAGPSTEPVVECMYEAGLCGDDLDAAIDETLKRQA